MRRWRELAEALFTKYNDGYVKDDKGEPQELGYPESWLREVVKARPRRSRASARGRHPEPRVVLTARD